MTKKRFTITCVTALFGAVAACTAFGADENDTATPPARVGPEAGLDGSFVSETGEICRNGSSNDPTNCGACGKNCLGATCEQGVCGIIDLVTGLDQPRYLRESGEDLFVTTNGALFRLPKLGGTATELVKGDLKQGLVVAGDKAICWGGDGIVMVDRAGGTPLSITTDDTTGLGVEGAFVYGCLYEKGKPHDIRRYERVSPFKVGKFVESAVECESIAVDATELFFGGQALFRTVLDGKSQPASELVHSEGTARKIVMDADWVYTTGDNSNEISKVARVGGAKTTIATSPDELQESDVAIDDTHVYWTSGRANGGVYRAPKAGVKVETIAAGLALPQGIAVDAKAVYWAERDSGRIRKKAK